MKAVLLSLVGLAMVVVAFQSYWMGEITGVTILAEGVSAFIFIGTCFVYRRLPEHEAALVCSDRGVKSGDYRLYWTDDAFCVPGLERLVRVTKRQAECVLRITAADGIVSRDGCAIETVIQLSAAITWAHDVPRAVAAICNEGAANIGKEELQELLLTRFRDALRVEAAQNTAVDIGGGNGTAPQLHFRKLVRDEAVRHCKKAGVTAEAHFESLILAPS